MKENSLISIILPVYNSEKFLEKCIESILKQTYQNFELIIINDGSTDNSKTICEKFATAHKNVKFFNKKNSGVSAARNYGLSKAKGDYICFIDSDDYIEKNYLEILLKTIIENNADIVECNYKRVDEIGNIIGKRDFRTFTCADNYEIVKGFAENIHFGNALWNKIYSKKVLKGLKFKELKTSEDYEYLANVYLKCNKKINISNYLYNYVNNSNSACNTYSVKQNLEVIYAREMVYDLYKKLNYTHLCSLISSKIIFYIFTFYRQTKKSNKEEKKYIRKELKRLYKKYYKNALKLQYRTNGSKITNKQKILEYIEFYSFLLFPPLTYLIIDIISKRNRS